MYSPVFMFVRLSIRILRSVECIHCHHTKRCIHLFDFIYQPSDYPPIFYPIFDALTTILQRSNFPCNFEIFKAWFLYRRQRRKRGEKTPLLLYSCRLPQQFLCAVQLVSRITLWFRRVHEYQPAIVRCYPWESIAVCSPRISKLVSRITLGL